MSAPPERRSTRQRKATVPFDEIVRPNEPAKPYNRPSKARKPHNDLALSRSSGHKAVNDAVQLLCNQTQSLNLQADPTENYTNAVEEAEEEAAVWRSGRLTFSPPFQLVLPS